jgi:TonB family protein
MKFSLYSICLLCLPFFCFSQISDSLSLEDEIFVKVDEPASFPGGIHAWGNDLNKNLKYPKQAQRMGIEGRVFVQFIVEKDGSLSNVKVVKGIGGGCDEEALRFVINQPKWIPGKQNGQPVRQKMIQNILFKLTDNSYRSGANSSNNFHPTHTNSSSNFDLAHFEKLVFLGNLEFDSINYAFIQSIDSASYFARPQNGYSQFFNDYKEAILSDASYKYMDTEISISFDILESGQLSNFNLGSDEHSNDTAIVRALMTLPDWKPALRAGQATKQTLGIEIVSSYGTVFEEVDVPAVAPLDYEIFLSQNLTYPWIAKKNGVRGTVIVEFIVERGGRISHAKIVKGIGSGCDEEALRFINSLPKWTAAYHKGKTVRQKTTLIIEF